MAWTKATSLVPDKDKRPIWFKSICSHSYFTVHLHPFSTKGPICETVLLYQIKLVYYSKVHLTSVLRLISKHGGSVKLHCGTIPSSLAKLVLAFRHGHSSSILDAIHKVNVPLTDLQLFTIESIPNFIATSFPNWRICWAHQSKRSAENVDMLRWLYKTIFQVVFVYGSLVFDFAWLQCRIKREDHCAWLKKLL